MKPWHLIMNTTVTKLSASVPDGTLGHRAAPPITATLAVLVNRTQAKQLFRRTMGRVSATNP